MGNTFIALAFLGSIAFFMIIGISFSLYLYVQKVAARARFASGGMYYEEERLTGQPVYLARYQTSQGTRYARATLFALTLLALATVSIVIIFVNGLLH